MVEELLWCLRGVERPAFKPVGFLAIIHYLDPIEELISFSGGEILRKEESSAC